jgi:transposase
MEVFEGDSGSLVSRLGVINTGRRRRFTEDEKLRIVAEKVCGERPCVGHGPSVRHQPLPVEPLAQIGSPGFARSETNHGFVPALVVPETFMPVKQATPPKPERRAVGEGRNWILPCKQPAEQFSRTP